ncbi:hypothetical protein B1748_26035, partial [Paenibacillus sp. MY03]
RINEVIQQSEFFPLFNTKLLILFTSSTVTLDHKVHPYLYSICFYSLIYFIISQFILVEQRAEQVSIVVE